MRNFGSSRKYLLYGLAIGACLVFAGSMFLFSEYLKEHTYKEVTNQFQNNTGYISMSIDAKFQDNLGTLTPLARFAGQQSDFLKNPSLQTLLSQFIEDSEYIGAFVFDAEGKSFSVGARPSKTNMDALLSQMSEDQSRVGQVMFNREGEHNWLIFMSPIMQDSRFVGSIATVVEADTFTSDIKLPSLDAGSMIFVLTPQKEVAFAVGKENNELSASKLEESLSKVGALQESEVYFTFQHGGETHYGYSESLGNSRLTVVTLVPQAVIYAKQRELWNGMMAVNSGVFFAIFLIIVFFILSRAEKRRSLEELAKSVAVSEHRFRMVSALSNTILFEWDIASGVIDFPNGFENAMGYSPPTENFPQGFIEKGLVHIDDAVAFADFHQQIQDESDKLAGTFRIRYKADDYRWFRFQEFIMRDGKNEVVRVIGKMQDAEEEKSQIESLKERNRIDSASGTFNKETTEQIIRHCLERQKTKTHCVMLLDIDDFKTINDSLGHLHGDRVIQQIGGVIKDCLRSSDMVGRVGGDEFMILIRDVPDELFVAVKAKNLLNDIRKQLEISTSIGIAIYPKNGTTFHDLYRAADKAMYKIKSQGKNGFAFSSAEDNLLMEEESEQLKLFPVESEIFN